MASGRFDGPSDLGVRHGAGGPSRTYRAAQAVAADNLRLGQGVVADCVNDSQEARNGWEACASRGGAEIAWLEIVCSDPAEHRRRVETRIVDVEGLRPPDWQAVATRGYDPWTRDHVTIDTAHKTLDACVEAALLALGASRTWPT